MQFDSFSAFLDMGGYGFFVWLSFGVTALAMLAIVVESRLARKQLMTTIVNEQARKARVKAARENAQTSTGESS